MNLDSLRTAADLSATKPHGTRLKYMAGVSACSVARQTRPLRNRARSWRKYGDWNGIVNARAARRHILKLPKAGVGYKSVADAASVGQFRRRGNPGSQEAPHPSEGTSAASLLSPRRLTQAERLINADPNRGRRAFTMYPTASRGVIRQKRQLCLAHAPKNALTALRPRRAATLQTRWQRSMTSSGVMETIRPRPGGFNRSMRRQPRRASRT